MSLLVLIYHRMSETGGGNANVHWLPFHQFREQMDHIRRAAYPVLSWHTFEAGAASADGVQIALTFDDGHRSDLECARLLKSLGYDALFFIATGYLGQDGYLHREDVAELRRLGMKIGSHSHRHIQLTPLSDADVIDELRRSRDILEDLVQQPVEHFSFPGGSYDTRILEMSRRAGYKYLFTSDWGLNHRAQFSMRALRRTSVLNHLDTAQFDALLRQSNYYVRQLGFKTKELMKRSLGMDRYVQIRHALVSLRKHRNGS
jgi:peptidoglycan/xylan/chitin deacetylase (PgdA/CDA1 family)